MRMHGVRRGALGIREIAMRSIALTAALVAALVGTGCSNNQDAGTVVGAITGGIIGNQFGKGGGRVAATLAGAVVGGIVGNEIGRSLDERDRELARQAEFDAWERGPPRQLALPRLHPQGLHRRPPASHARHGLPQSRRHLDPGRLISLPAPSPLVGRGP
jgi:hypothetical protein